MLEFGLAIAIELFRSRIHRRRATRSPELRKQKSPPRALERVLYPHTSRTTTIGSRHGIQRIGYRERIWQNFRALAAGDERYPDLL